MTSHSGVDQITSFGKLEQLEFISARKESLSVSLSECGAHLVSRCLSCAAGIYSELSLQEISISSMGTLHSPRHSHEQQNARNTSPPIHSCRVTGVN